MSDVFDLDLYIKNRKKDAEEIQSNIYQISDTRRLYLKVFGRNALLVENYNIHNNIESTKIYLEYKENPGSPIDDSDTGSGYYSPSTIDDIKFANLILALWKMGNLKSLSVYKSYTDTPPIRMYEMPNGRITNYPMGLNFKILYDKK
jgi:hypothetical protein